MEVPIALKTWLRVQSWLGEHQMVPRVGRRRSARRRRSAGVIAIGSIFACALAGSAGAQDKPAPAPDKPAAAADKPADNMEVLREKARVDKKLVVASVLSLTEGEAKAFWPVYNAYQSDMVSHYDRLMKLIDAYAASYETMTDEKATKLLADYLALERAHVALLTSYLPRFQKVLPPKKVARLYQIENKMRALVNYELGREIPIVK